MLPRVVPLLFTLFLFSFLAPSIASAWFVVNESTIDLDGRVLDVADGFDEFLTFTVNSASSIDCPFNQSPCNPPLSVDSELIVLLTSTDGESFECELDMRGNGVVAVRSQDRDSPLPANLYCFSINAGNLEDASDPFALDAEKGTLAPMTAVNRSIRFFASGDPQYNNADIGSSGNTSGAAADSDLMLAIIRNETTADNSIRGVIVNGDLTQNARGDNDGNPFQSSDELEAYMRATATEQHMFFEGLGNHDVESTGSTSAPEDMIEFVRDKPRNTVRSGASAGGHYSWDWHDVHFVQLNTYPGTEPNTLYPDIDPEDSLAFLIFDLASTVGNSGRPVILNHHYGFDENISFDYWTLPEKAAYWNAIANYNVVAIFTGHDHQSSLSDDWIHPFLPPGLVASGPNLPVARPDGRTCLPTFNGAALLAQAFLDVEIVGDTMTVTREAANGSTSSVSFAMGSADVPYSATQTLNCPEPGQVAMLLPGLGMLGWLGRRKASRLSVARIRPYESRERMGLRSLPRTRP